MHQLIFCARIERIVRYPLTLRRTASRLSSVEIVPPPFSLLSSASASFSDSSGSNRQSSHTPLSSSLSSSLEDKAKKLSRNARKRLRHEEHLKSQREQVSHDEHRQQRNHEERIQRQKNDKEDREQSNKVTASRRRVSHSIAYWLGNNPTCFDTTMGALNLQSRSDATTMDTSGEGMVPRQYRQLYMDTIPDFTQAISGQFSRAIHEQDSPDQPEGQYLPPNEMLVVLDKLVEAGFDDLSWAKRYREMRKYQGSYEEFLKKEKEYTEKVERKRKHQARLQEAIQHLQIQIDKRIDHDQMERKQEQARKKAEQAREEEEQGEPPRFFSGLFKSISSILEVSGKDSDNSQPAERSHVDEPGPENMKDTTDLESLCSELGELQKQLRSVIGHVRDRQRSVDNLQKEREKLQPMLSEAEYEAATRVVQSVLIYICQEFARFISHRHAKSIEQFQTLDSKTDLTKPQEWYPYARLDRRKITFHGGPTNSGKTFNALQKLKDAKNGLYLGPLRLLAGEIYDNLTSQGIYTRLRTGQEKQDVPFSSHTSATVEMASTTEEYDVVVIDEIQMLQDEFRGFAWTRALQGLRCKEIHVCGGMEAEPIVRKIVHGCGDHFELYTYERFSDLDISFESLSSKPGAKGSYKNVRPGDCVVAFSRNDIFAIQKEIESTTSYKCSIIYGSLPPETRTDQARRFNNPDSGYDILVASDAIGMGLNLNIRRIIFNSLYKSDGEKIKLLDHSAVKQIAGRAGRRNSPYPNGEVTCRDPRDMAYLRTCMTTEIQPLEKAGLLPTSEHIKLFSEALQTHNLAKDASNLENVLDLFSEMAKVKGDYKLCRQRDMSQIARHLEDIDIPISEKYLMTMAPVSVSSNKHSADLLRRFAVKYERGEAAGIGRLVIKKPKTYEDLTELCRIHSDLELFLWLHYRFPSGNIVEQQAAIAAQELTISYISKALENGKLRKLDHCYIKRDRRLRSGHEKASLAARRLRESLTVDPRPEERKTSVA